MPARHPESYEEAAKQAGVTARIPLGVRPIRVMQIVGTVGKAGKLGPDFLPLGPGPGRARFQTILQNMSAEEPLPPIGVYQLGHRYFVVDGHARVAAARALNIPYIDAHITECIPSKDRAGRQLHFARREFERATGLEDVRLTAAWRYDMLQQHIEGYRRYLESSLGREVTTTEAARTWARTQYMPTLAEIRRRKLGSLAGYTAGDVYTDLLQAWTEDRRSMSLRELLDEYDAAVKRSTIGRARRMMTDLVDRTMPRVLTDLARPDRDKLTEMEVAAELAAPGQDDALPEHPNAAGDM